MKQKTKGEEQKEEDKLKEEEEILMQFAEPHLGT